MAPAPAQKAVSAAAVKLYEQSLHTSSLELRYASSVHEIDLITKDEDIRLLRFDLHILQDDNAELRDLLAQEEERSDAFEKLVNDNLQRAEDAEAQVGDMEEELRRREQELCAALAERNALQTNAKDSESFLSEKLALMRELSILRPELAHVKEQAASAEALLTDKLELQRQLTELQCELENAKRDVKRALAKRRNTGVEIAQEEQVEDLKRQLAKEKRARLRAEEAAVNTSQGDVTADEVRKELVREKRARQKAEEALAAAQENTQAEDVRRDLLNEKKARQKLEDAIESLQAELEKEQRAAERASKRAEGVSDADDQLDELRQELAKERKERSRTERAAQKAAEESESHKATLDDKLGQFRAKLKLTKEKLKETEAELAAARAGALSNAVASKKAAAALVANPKKRSAPHLDPDATNLGTPGDGPTTKRGRRAPVVIGDKSAFSTTPYLNRTMSVVEQDADDDPDTDGEADAVASPSAVSVCAQPSKRILAPVSANGSNTPKQSTAVRQRKNGKPAAALEAVAEEDAAAEDRVPSGKENIPVPTAAHLMKIKTKVIDGPSENDSGANKKRSKIRKSLVDFETFNAEPAPEKKKKRKLGGLGKTLFDEDDDGAVLTTTTKAVLPAGRMFLGGSLKGLAAGAGGVKKGGFLGAGRLGSSISAPMNDGGAGFQFSPLKKSRRNLDDTLRG